jgi:hypothetical protein
MSDNIEEEQAVDAAETFRNVIRIHHQPDLQLISSG